MATAGVLGVPVPISAVILSNLTSLNAGELFETAEIKYSEDAIIN